ncbi:hypothetical protein [Halobacteriaceae bacterium SHR40]|uniref:hypothetical protein n=1 Tax=Halovenus amylolytica TaxID=2500550 RepID=UPI000FE34425
MNKKISIFRLFLLGLFIRLLAILPATFQMTTYAQGDPVTFARTAEFIAAGLREGVLQYPEVTHTNRLWGTFLAPFWLIPGPSAVYARIILAIFGALTVYNVYVISQTYYSHRAGVYAALPMAFLPSHFLLHGTLMRDTLLIFCLTLVAQLIIVPSNQKKTSMVAVGTLAFILAYILRPDNVGIYIFVSGLGIFFLIWGRHFDNYPFIVSGLTVTLGTGLLFTALSLTPRALSEVLALRMGRAQGTATYLAGYHPENVIEMFIVSPLLAIFFLFVPLPWMVNSIPAIIPSLEGFVIFIYCLAAVASLPVILNSRHRHTAFPLLIGAVLGIVFYGLVLTNFGAATRFRQMFTWVLFIFGGIGLAVRVDIRLFDYSSDNSDSRL